MDTVRRSSSRTLLAWGFIGILGVVCVVVGIGKGGATGLLSFEAVKFTAAGVILLAIATYKVARRARQR
jgi:hypothetical protein